MLQSELIRLIRAEAMKHGIDPDLAQAVAMNESACAWPGRSSRYEPGYKYVVRVDAFAKVNGISYETELREQMSSWGPMHIMGGVAREVGYAGPLPNLFQPALGVKWAMQKLKQICDRYESEPAILATYNGGSPQKRADPDGGGFVYKNQRYVDEGLARVKEYRKGV